MKRAIVAALATSVAGLVAGLLSNNLTNVWLWVGLVIASIVVGLATHWATSRVGDRDGASLLLVGHKNRVTQESGNGRLSGTVLGGENDVKQRSSDTGGPAGESK